MVENVRWIEARANFTRVVHGETLPFEYLRLTVNLRAPALLSWDRVKVP